MKIHSFTENSVAVLQKKILIVVESIDVDDSSGSKANVALIHNLQQSGFKLLILHYTRKEIQLASIKCIAINEEKFSANYFLSRIQRKIQHWFGVNLAKYLEPKFGFSFTFFNDVQSIKNALEEYKGFNPDLVLTLSKGASFRPHYAMLNYPNFHDQWMAYIHDPYPFHYYPEPYNWSEPGYTKKIKFFSELAEKCNWAAFPSELLKEWMTEKFSEFQGKVVILPHQLIEKQISEELPDFFDPEKFTVMHAGNLMKQRPPFHLIKAFQKFLENVPEAKKNAYLLLIGNASYHKKELEKVKKSIEMVIIRDYLEYKQTQQLQRKVSVNVILESKAAVSPFLPGKFPHCIAAEKPILLLGPKKSESRRLLGEEYPYWSEIDNEKKITQLLEDLYKSWVENKRNLKMKREDLKNYLSADHLKFEIEKNLN